MLGISKHIFLTIPCLMRCSFTADTMMPKTHRMMQWRNTSIIREEMFVTPRSRISKEVGWWLWKERFSTCCGYQHWWISLKILNPPLIHWLWQGVCCRHIHLTKSMICIYLSLWFACIGRSVINSTSLCTFVCDSIEGNYPLSIIRK